MQSTWPDVAGAVCGAQECLPPRLTQPPEVNADDMFSIPTR